MATAREKRQGHALRRAAARVIWLMNPLARRLAGIAPWWVVLETTGRKSGRPRQVPLARGPLDGDTTWVIAVHGARAGFAHNIAASPRVRLRLRGRWRDGTASVEPFDPAVVKRFSRYARGGPLMLGIEPALVRIELDAPARGSASPSGAAAGSAPPPAG
jgi:deazaflavin-dependent oxidoreductase (nitroreductase family)